MYNFIHKNIVNIIFIMVINSFGLTVYIFISLYIFITHTKAEIPNNAVNFTRNHKINNFDDSHEARFAYPGEPNLEVYGPSVLSKSPHPRKLDLEGLLLGGVVGFGALLLIPRMIHLFIPELALYGHHAYGVVSPNRRDSNGLPQEINQNEVNSSECIHKFICAYVQSSAVQKTDQNQQIENNDGINRLTSGSIIDFVINGSKFEEAVENGKKGVNCSKSYAKCPFNQVRRHSKINYKL